MHKCHTRCKMEYVAQIEKTVDILSFLLSKIPLDYDGEGSWLTNSLQTFIKELKHQQEINVHNAVDDELIKDSNLDEKIGPSCTFEENANDSKVLEKGLKTFEESSSIISAPSDDSLQVKQEPDQKISGEE